MSSRLYDYIITVTDTTGYTNGNNFIGLGSGTFGIISNVNHATSNLKVRVANALQEYTVGEAVTSNHYLLSNVISVQTFASGASTSSFTLTGDTVPDFTNELVVFVDGVYRHDPDWSFNGSAVVFDANALPGQSTVTVKRETGNVESQSFAASVLSLGNVASLSSTTITAIYSNPFISSTHAFTQQPLVRLFDIYYPGEWYPPNENGNPSGKGAGLPWPSDMPWRIAEVVGDIHSDLQYNVTFGTDSYIPYPLESDGIETSSDGTINDFNIKISNFDGVVTAFVENPFLVGNVTSNSAQGIVNGELVYGLDPRTVVTNVHFDQSVVDSFYPGANSAWTKSEADKQGETFAPLKYDSRDFLGGVIEIKSTFANHLNYWPEYSTIDVLRSNTVEVINSAAYRVGDVVRANSNSTTATIVAIEDNGRVIWLDNPVPGFGGDKLFIVNPDFDPEAYVKDTFKIAELATLNEKFAEFRLTSWLQYFKLQLPKRKFYRNTCQWEYKGEECQYPGPGSLAIPGTIPQKTSNANPIDINNQIAASAAEDDCAKSFAACKVRNNTIHFGAYPGTGRQIPKQ